MIRIRKITSKKKPDFYTNDLDMYEGSTNNRLLYQILARIIGSAFFLKYNTGEVTLPKDYTFATLTMDAISEVDITVGIIGINIDDLDATELTEDVEVHDKLNPKIWKMSFIRMRENVIPRNS